MADLGMLGSPPDSAPNLAFYRNLARYARNVRDMGVSLIGGCCGSTPKHIRAMAEALGSLVPG